MQHGGDVLLDLGKHDAGVFFALGAGFGWRALVSWFASDMYRMAICLIGAARSGEDTALVRCLTFAATAGLGAFGAEVEPVDLPALVS